MSARLLWTLGLLVAIAALRALVGALMRRSTGDGPLHEHTAHRRFVVQQVASLFVLLALLGGLTRIWFSDPGRLATVVGLATAGIAVALQRVITAFAAYLIILRSRIFAIGDRITIGGVRGDVVAMGLMQTTVMEMGEPPSAQSGDPKVWVNARQYTGRLIRVTNDKIFDTPVYNYTREFPWMWEELSIPVKYDADYGRAEEILLAAAHRHTDALVTEARPNFEALRSRYLVSEQVSLEPHVYLRMTDNWIELSLRFIAPLHGVRSLMNAIHRDVLRDFAEAKLEVASSTYDIVGLPPIRVRVESPPR